ncbi:MAG TPA: hypothetical protein VN901_12395, partial [Candidatus Acidoferrales bacterium]|nr:hypothetical protein [Candidatus Acidoferrales bacterium]
GDRGQDIADVVNESDSWHGCLLAFSITKPARALDEKVESIVDSHDGTNQIQHPHWYKGASHEWGSLIPMICANVSWLRSKPAVPVWKLPSCTTWL